MPGAHRSGFHYFPAERNDFTGGNISITESGSSENSKVAIPNSFSEGFTRPLPPFRLDQKPRAIGGTPGVLGIAHTGLGRLGFAYGQRLDPAIAPVGHRLVILALTGDGSDRIDALCQFVISGHFGTSDHAVKILMPLMAQHRSGTGLPISAIPEFTAQCQFKAKETIRLGNFFRGVLPARVTRTTHLV